MPSRLSQRRWSWPWLMLLGLLLVLYLTQCLSLVHRVTKNATDFTVFYDTSRLLARGAGGEIYASHDTVTDWMRTIPPFGQMFIQPLAFGKIQTAAHLWNIFNTALLLSGMGALAYFGRNLDAKSRLFTASLAPMAALWLAMAPGCVQVGQYSILFAAFWIFFLALRASPYRRFASAALAVPAGIKLYPVFLPAIFLLQRRPKAFLVTLLFCSLTVAIPFLVYGTRTPALTASFWNHAIASRSSRINESQNAITDSNQGIDSIMLRYLVGGQKIQADYPGFPHLNLKRSHVLRFTNALRLLVLVLTGYVAWRAWPQLEPTPLWGTFLLLALLCACLYVLIPGTKSRYAIYTFLSFVPLILQATGAQKLGRKVAFWNWNLVILMLVLLVLQFLPYEFRVYGVCFAGHVALWGINLGLVWRYVGRKSKRMTASASPSIVRQVGASSF